MIFLSDILILRIFSFYILPFLINLLLLLKTKLINVTIKTNHKVKDSTLNPYIQNPIPKIIEKTIKILKYFLNLTSSSLQSQAIKYPTGIARSNKIILTHNIIKINTKHLNTLLFLVFYGKEKIR